MASFEKTVILVFVDEKGDKYRVYPKTRAECIEGFDEIIDRISALELGGGGNSTGGLTSAQITALDGMFRAVAYIKPNVYPEYRAFKDAFNISDSSSGSDRVLTGISVTYSGGDVYTGALLTDLSGVVVTAIYSDGTSEIVSGYILSGEIFEGQNTITVTYNGMIDTFVVTGLPHEEEGIDGNDPPFDAATWTDGLRITSNGAEYTGHANYSTSSYVDVSGVETFTITRSDEVSGNVNFLCCFYDSEQSFISGTTNTYINANGTSYPISATVDVPEGTTYCRICGTKLSGVSFNELVKITV